MGSMESQAHPILSRIEECLSRVSPRRILVACSGGRDSTVLAHAMERLGLRHSWVIELAYFNHRLRGSESDAEETACLAMAQRLGLRLHVGRWDQPERGEAKARQARYCWLGSVARQGGHEAILTAHHRRDQAETLLIRLIRGTGLDGLTAMGPVAPLPVGIEEQIPGVAPSFQDGTVGMGVAPGNVAGPGTGASAADAGPDGPEQAGVPGDGSGPPTCPILLRPILSVPPAEIEQYARRHGLTWFEDSSNRSMDFLRNRVRVELLPLMEELRPGAERRLAQLAEHLREEKESLDRLVKERFSQVARAGSGWILLPRSDLVGSAGRRLILLACRRLGKTISELDLPRVRDLLSDARDNERRQRTYRLAKELVVQLLGKETAILSGAPWAATTGGEQPLFSAGTGDGGLGEDPRIAEPGQGVPLPVPGALKEMEKALDIQIVAPGQSSSQPDPWPNLALRFRRPGERFPGSRTTLKRAFIKAGLPRFLRPRYPLLEDEFGLCLISGIWRRRAPPAPEVEVRFGSTWPHPLLPRNTGDHPG